MSVAYKFKVTLWDNTGTSKWRGAQTAVIFDAKNIGVEEFANDPGSAYWTLSNDHPQLSKHIPLSTHYEISRWADDQSRWEFVGAGMLNDYQSTPDETIFSGLDYKSILNQIYTPFAGMTSGDASVLNPLIDASNDSVNNDEFGGIGFSGYTVNFTNNLTVENVTISAIASAPYSVYNSGFDLYDELVASGTAPCIDISYDLVWSGATTGFSFGGWPDNGIFTTRIIASPPAVKDSGTPPLGATGVISYGAVGGSNASTGTGRFKSSQRVRMFGKEIESVTGTAPGINDLTWNLGPFVQFPINTVTDSVQSLPNSTFVWNPLRNGITYTFQIFGSIERTSNTSINVSKIGAITEEATLGSASNENTQTIITRVYNNAKTSSTNSRIAWSTLTTIGSSVKTYDSYSAGEPTLNYIANLCDIEMGSKTDESRVVFGISKPTGSSTYSGGFTLNLSVSSAATTAIALKYPENITSFGFSPGYSKVKNDVTVIPYGTYATGSTGTNVDGVSIIGSSASDSASISSYGRIPLIVTKSGYIDTAIASAEATRLLSAYSPDNTRSVNLRVTLGAVDIWNGWDVGESINVKIRRGLVDIDEPFVISGVRWFGEANGSERIELELVQGSKFNSTRI